jgi:hypothetical protein
VEAGDVEAGDVRRSSAVEWAAVNIGPPPALREGSSPLAQLSLLALSGGDFDEVKVQESESHQRGAFATRL